MQNPSDLGFPRAFQAGAQGEGGARGGGRDEAEYKSAGDQANELLSRATGRIHHAIHSILSAPEKIKGLNKIFIRHNWQLPQGGGNGEELIEETRQVL